MIEDNSAERRRTTLTEPQRFGSRWPGWLKYLVTIAIEAGLTTFLLALHRYIPVGRFPIPYVLAIGVIAYFLGDGPAILAFIIGALAFIYYFVPPEHALWPIADSPLALAGLIAFIIGTSLVALGMLSIRRSELQTQEALKEARYELAERQRVEEELRRGEAQLRTIIQSLTEGLVVSDLEGNTFLWNDAAIRIHGFHTLEEAQRRLPEFTEIFELSTMDGKVLPLDQWPLSRILRGEVLRDWEVRVRRINIDWERIFSYGGSLVRTPEGQTLMAVVTVADITARKQAEEEIRKLNAELEQRVQQRTAELEAANKELESFSYSVSHDLRAPLRAIDGFSSAVSRNYRDNLDARGQDYLDRIRAAAQRMGDLIDDILGLSRATRAEVRRERTNLSGMVEDILSELMRSQPERKAEISVEPDVRANADPHLIQIALRNLLENAWKFTTTRDIAKISFETQRQDGELVYRISDNGVGFDPEYAGKLFTPFQRLHTEAEFPGTGIGLALVQRIIRKHGGRIWAEGAVGKGATIYFTLG